MRYWVNGEILSEDERVVCYSEGKKYSFVAAGEECEDCPDGAICYGGDEVYPEKDYWRSSRTSSNFIECPVEDAWLGGNSNTSYTGECDEDAGYSGRLCTVCLDDYTRISKF